MSQELKIKQCEYCEAECEMITDNEGDFYCSECEMYQDKD